MKARLAGFFTCAALLSPLCNAHHSYSAWSPELVTVNGTVKDFQWTNPHIWIQVVVPVADGQPVEWGFESAAPGMLKRFGGWKATAMKPGDKVVVTFHPKRDGTRAGSLVKVTLPDQTVLEVRDLVLGPPGGPPGGTPGGPPTGEPPPGGEPPSAPPK